MNPRRTHFRPSSNRGAAMLAALCFSLVLAIALSSYITMCYRSLQMSTRNASNGHAVELAETGMEEALWALHANDWTGWTISGKTATKTLSGFTFDANTTGSASLSIANYDGTTGTRTVTVTGTTTLSDGTTQSRTLTSTTTQAPLFVNAIAGTNGIVQFKSGGTVDSYDSTTDVNAATAGYSAIVASLSTATGNNTVQMTNVQIKGYVASLTGPSYSTGGKLLGPTTAMGVNVDTTRVSTSPYQPIFDELVPSAPNPLPGGSSITIGTAGATTPTYYYDNSTTLNHHDTLTVDGPVVLVISGSLNISSTAQIIVTTNGSLEIHVTGNVAIDGYGILNNTNLPKNVSIFSSSSTATLEMNTTTAFRGVIYAPNAALTINSSSQTIYGSLVAKSVTVTSSPAFHYDTSLRTVAFAGIDTPYAVANVHETTSP